MKYVAIIALACAGCAGAKPILRTIDDAATTLCLLAAAEQPSEKIGGMTPEQWCAIKENFQPFIDEALAAQKAAASRTGLSGAEAGE